MKVGSRGIALIKSFEELRLLAYQDSVGVWTIGWGHTGAEVKKGDLITEAQAGIFLQSDLAWVEKRLNELVRPATRQSEFDAIASLAFNVGAEKVADSTMLKRHNANLRLEASKEFPRWDRAGGKELRGLLRRRFMEAALYLEDG